MPDGLDHDVYMPTIDFSQSRTVSDFIRCNTFVQGILGGFGSGKSYACCVKIGMYAMAQAPNEKNMRRSRWLVIRNCYDDETEILTERRGWQLFKKLNKSDKVAMLKDGETVFVKPTMHYKAPYNGEMVGFDGEGVNFLVTPDHHLYTSKTVTRAKMQEPYSHKKAADVYGNGSHRVKRDALWTGKEHGKSVAFSRWLGFWFAEGSAGTYGRHRRCNITQVKPEGIAYAESLFKEADIPYAKDVRTTGGICFRLPYRPDTEWLFDLCGKLGKATTKRVPQWMKDAPPDHLLAFIDAFIEGDGWTVKASRFACTSSKGLADDLQEMALKAGLVANITQRDLSGLSAYKGSYRATVPGYVVTFVRPCKYAPRLKKSSTKTRYRGWYKRDYSGMVYCVEVPTHVVYVRRRGRAMWCGQTYAELRSTTIKTWLELYPEESCGKITYGAPIRQHIYRPAHGKTPGLDMEVLFLALDRPDHAAKLKSLEVTGAWVNEAIELPWELIDVIIGRVRRFPARAEVEPSWSGLIMDTNACDDTNWWYRVSEQDEVPKLELDPDLFGGVDIDFSWRFYKQPPAVLEVEERGGKFYVNEPGWDPVEVPENHCIPAAGCYWMVNPEAENLAHLARGYYHQQILNRTKVHIQRYLQAKYVYISEGAAWLPEYNDQMMCREAKYNPNLPLIGGVDAGSGALNPAAAFGQRGVLGDWRILSELPTFATGIAEFSVQLSTHIANTYQVEKSKVKFWLDPACRGGDEVYNIAVEQHFTNNGFNVELAPTNATMTRREALALPMGRLIRTADGQHFPGLIVHPRCVWIRQGFSGKWFRKRVKDGEERYTPEPVKNQWSHICEAAGYMVLGGGEHRELTQGRRDPDRKPFGGKTTMKMGKPRF